MPAQGASARLDPMMRMIAPLLLVPLLAACSLPRFGAEDRPDIAVTENPGDETLRPQSRPGAPTALEGTAPGADTAGNVPPPPEAASDGLLGETLAGLGATGGPGNWLSTGLVSSARPGRVETASGGSLSLELRPSGAAPSAGSTISLQAMQALGLPLGQLATLRVFTD